MDPLGILIAFGILGVLSVGGALMVVMSSRRLLRLGGNPGPSWQHLVEPRASIRVVASVQLVLLTLGLLLLALGVRGVYRVIWSVD